MKNTLADVDLLVFYIHTTLHEYIVAEQNQVAGAGSERDMVLKHIKGVSVYCTYVKDTFADIDLLVF